MMWRLCDLPAESATFRQLFERFLVSIVRVPSAKVYPSIFQVPCAVLVHEIESLSTRATPVFGELEMHGVGVLSDTVTREVG